MTVKSYQEKLRDKEYAILEGLYDYRTMTTEQIRKKYSFSEGRYIEKYLYRMRTRKLIKTATLKRSRKGKKGFSYHRLTETGMECLARHGKRVEGRFNPPYIRPVQVPYLLLANDVMVNIAKTNWKMRDSRRAKKEFSIDVRNIIQGSLISPLGEKYGLYVLEPNVTETTIGKIHSEIRTYPDLNYMVVAKGKEAYNKFINQALNPPERRENNKKVKQKPLFTGNKIKVVPFAIWTNKVNRYENEHTWLEKLGEVLDVEIKSTVIPKGKRQTFPTIVEHNEEEKYLIDLTETDMTDILNIELYRNQSYKWEQKRLLVVTLPIEETINLVKNNPYVDLKVLESEINDLQL